MNKCTMHVRTHQLYKREDVTGTVNKSYNDKLFWSVINTQQRIIQASDKNEQGRCIIYGYFANDPNENAILISGAHMPKMLPNVKSTEIIFF